MPEAPVRMSKNGLVVDGEGWFVMNARESRWKNEGPLGSYCTFEGSVDFRILGSTSASSTQVRKWACTTARKARKHFLSLRGVHADRRRPRAEARSVGLLLLRSGDGAHHRHVRCTVSDRGWRLALAVDASAEWFTRSVRPPPGTELASQGKQQSPLSPTQRCTRASRDRGSSSTGRVGFASRSEVVAWASVLLVLNTVHIGATQLVPIRASAHSRAIGGLSLGLPPNGDCPS
jgi:hypothetical protein